MTKTGELIKWSNHYSVMVSEIDSQHKELISLINRLFDAMNEGKGIDIIEQVLTSVIDYTVYHFATEEKLFRQFDYPEEEHHRMLHRELTTKAKRLQDDFSRGNSRIAMEVMLFLSNWLNYHILEEDKKFGLYLKINPSVDR